MSFLFKSDLLSLLLWNRNLLNVLTLDLGQFSKTDPSLLWGHFSNSKTKWPWSRPLALVHPLTKSEELLGPHWQSAPNHASATRNTVQAPSDLSSCIQFKGGNEAEEVCVCVMWFQIPDSICMTKSNNYKFYRALETEAAESAKLGRTPGSQRLDLAIKVRHNMQLQACVYLDTKPTQASWNKILACFHSAVIVVAYFLLYFLYLLWGPKSITPSQWINK
jgi:hypothetical protein